ncbi:hypothetical protein HJG60_008331 [Phyllostomus discolor]|uniref:Uncharacterized protein n=1 Tax=Phyllostomus discolor TaxID=89673 RepID=A0A833Z8Y4_9CHIR|nr:hypothetical protein HJG60_008331 [Phyllostomus discolor]
MKPVNTLCASGQPREESGRTSAAVSRSCAAEADAARQVSLRCWCPPRRAEGSPHPRERAQRTRAREPRLPWHLRKGARNLTRDPRPPRSPPLDSDTQWLRTWRLSQVSPQRSGRTQQPVRESSCVTFGRRTPSWHRWPSALAWGHGSSREANLTSKVSLKAGRKCLSLIRGPSQHTTTMGTELGWYFQRLL